MLDNGDLYVKDASEHDNTYSFRCHSENTITKEKKISKNYARVIVTGKYPNIHKMYPIYLSENKFVFKQIFLSV